MKTSDQVIEEAKKAGKVYYRASSVDGYEINTRPDFNGSGLWTGWPGSMKDFISRLKKEGVVIYSTGKDSKKL